MPIAQAVNPEEQAARRVSWGAIFAGAVVALALTIFFATLGVAIGAGAIDPTEGDDGGLGWASALYFIITQILSLLVGGFTASRLAGVPRMTASALHGASVWALTTVAIAWAGAAGTGALFSTASSMLGSAAQGAANIAQAVAPDDMSFPNPSDIAGRISESDLPEPVQNALEEMDISVDVLRREAKEAFSAVVSDEEQKRAFDRLQSALADVVKSPSDMGEDLNAALDNLVGGPDAILSDEDWQEALRVLQRRLQIKPQEAEQLVQTIQAQFEEAVTGMRQGINEAQEQALEAIEAAASAVSAAAWGLTVASLLALGAALSGAVLGKPDGMLGDRLDDRYSQGS